MNVYRTQHLYFALEDQLEKHLKEIIDKAFEHLELERQKLVVTVHDKEQRIFSPD